MIKQVIVVRKDLKMRAGKLAGQVAHASLSCILNKLTSETKTATERLYVNFTFTEDEYNWITETSESKFTKVVLKVNSEDELLAIYNKAIEAGINASLIKDAGNTVFTEPTYTCVGLGPAEDILLDEITGDLKLY